MENQTENQENEQILRDFYNVVIGDLKNQISTLAEQKSLQYALHQQDQRIIKQLTEQLKEAEQKIINKENGSVKKS